MRNLNSLVGVFLRFIIVVELKIIKITFFFVSTYFYLAGEIKQFLSNIQYLVVPNVLVETSF